MKFGWKVLLGFLLTFLLSGYDADAATNKRFIPIAVNDDLLTFPDALPFVQDSTTYVPVRFLTESFGATLTVHNPGVITVELRDKSVILYTKEDKIQLSNGEHKDIPLFVENGRTYAPLRAIGEYFGYQVHYIREGPVVRLVDHPNVSEGKLFIEENLVKIKDFYEHVNKKKKPKVYLTFDDGPNSDMKSILSILKEKGAKATFFMIETQMSNYEQELKRLVKDGHYPALHSVSHDKTLLYKGKTNAVAKEMLKTQKTLYELTGIKTNLTRVPFGSKPYMTIGFRDELVRSGFKMWDWNIDSEDWMHYRTNPKQIAKNVKESFKVVKKKTESVVILFHINSGTAEVLPEIIDFIYEQGYQCVAYNPNDHFMVNFWDDPRL